MASRDQALSLLSAASNHNDLAVKLSSLRQAKDILLAVEPSLAADLFPYLAALQSCPEPLVRKMLLEIIQEIGLRAMEHSSELIPVLLTFMGDSDPLIARQSIVSGTHFFCAVVEEMAFQFHRRGKVEWWLKELWRLMLRFKDAVFTIALEPGSVGMKLQALKFLETYVLLFTDDTNDSEKFFAEGSRRLFNISWLVDGHPVLDPVALTSDANNTLFILLGSLRSPGSLPGVLTIAVVNCLAAIARKRPIHYDTVVSALLDFEQKIDMMKGCHIASIQYCIRTALLGFLRCINPAILESRDRLLRALRLMNAGDAADQVIRQVDKMIKNNERASRDARFGKEDPLSSQLPAGDQLRKRTVPLDVEEPANGHEVAVKHFRYSPNMSSTAAIQINDSEQDSTSINGVLTNAPQLDGDMTPAEQMIAMIGALLAEGERGAESLEILISNIHPDLLADIVITNMRHLPKVSPPLTRVGNSSVTYQIGSLNSPTKVLVPSSPINPIPPAPPAQQSFSTATANTSSLSDGMTVNNFATDPKRDPRRDPRRLDPRRTTTPIALPSVVTDDSGGLQLEFDSFASLSKPVSLPATTTPENPPAPFVPNCKSIDQTTESPLDSEIDRATLKEESLSRPEEIVPPFEINTSSDNTLSPVQTVDEDSAPPELSDDEVIHDADTSSVIESDEDNLAPSNTYVAEETCLDLPQLPEYVELTEEQQRTVSKLAVERIIDLYSHGTGANCCQTRMALLGRLVAQSDTHDDIVAMLQKHIVLDYRMQKGHEVVMHILYHLHSLMILDSGGSSSHAVVYEKFLLVMAKSLLDAFPASDKSFSKLLGEVPLLPEAALKLLDDLCYCDVYDSSGKEIRDGERVTQGLGAVWSLILGRPNHRQVCLDIALKCAVHAQDDIRGKAIRLVANKLYHLDYISENIEQYATKMLLSAVHQHTSDIKALQSVFSDQREEEVGSQEASINSSHATETETSGNGPIEGVQPVVQSGLATSFAEAQRLTSLYFALCTKKPSLLQLVFDIYGCAPKTVKQAVHRNMPTLISALGSSYSELLRIISDPPEGCENLLMLVLQILTQEMTPSADLIAIVKHLHETKLKDATILIPILSSLSKMEVLPIFPRLVSLPLEKFQMALAHILQGSAHTGPALTPAEVLVAIHDISPEKDGLALKKITDACSACFEQRTIFTQQVFAKALNQMVDQTPLPLLFMRTVIQAVNAFPPMVGFVMEILSKLVSRQVWTMPKLWFGFLKCVSQTWPHSYDVLAQLPPPQLESVFQRHGNLKKAMVSHVNDNGLSLPRSTLAVLGLANESLMQQPHVSTLHPPDTSPSVHRASLT